MSTFSTMRPAFATWRWQQAAWGGATLVLFALTMLWVKKIQVWLPMLPVCWFHRLSGLPCPACGATRATMAFVHGDWLAALQWNPLIATIYAAIIIGGMMMVLFAMMNKRLRGRQIDAVLAKARWWLVGAATANWIYLLAREGVR